MVLYVNGREAYTTIKLGRNEEEHTIELELRQGINHFMVMLLNVHVICKSSFSMIIEGLEYEVDLPLITKDEEERMAIEEDIKSLWLSNDIVSEGDKITVSIDRKLKSKSKFIFTIISDERKNVSNKPVVVFRKEFTNIESECREIYLCDADVLKWEGKYNVLIECTDKDSNLIECLNIPIKKVYFTEDIITGNYQDRVESLFKIYTEYNEDHIKTGGFYAAFFELAKLEAERFDLLNESRILEAIDYINKRFDCADFALHGLMRLYIKYKDSDMLSIDLKQRIKHCILGFKYAIDEPGKSMMFTRSENHEMLFCSAEYIAGLLFPTENFTNSNQNGLFHALRGRLNAERWIKEKGTYGLTEWHSNNYFEEDILALLTIYDFGEENSYIRILAKNLMDLLCLIIATHTHKGVMGTTHGRCYEESLIHPELEVMSQINWLLMGQPGKHAQKVSIGAVSLASSSYKPEDYIEKIGNSNEEIYTLTKMGLFPWLGLGGVNCATYRTKDFMVSGLVESMQGTPGYQVQAGQVLLDGSVPVFVSCFDDKSPTTSPSYWGGQYRIPKMIAHKNILAYICNIDTIAGYTHCYFPFRAFDSTVEHGNWLFGCKNDAYIALYSLKPYTKVSEGSYKDRELLCMEKRNIWLIEAGNKEKWESFECFVEAILSSEITKEGEDLTYVSPTNGVIKLGWDIACKVDGKELAVVAFPLIKNQYAYGEYGDGLTYIKYNGQERILNFKL